AADAARRGFVRQRRLGWSAAARHASVLSRWTAGDRSPALLAAARRSAAALERSGWDELALEAHIVAGRIALERGSRSTAASDLARARAATRARTGAVRVRAWEATAVERLARGDERGARAALLAAIGAVDRQRLVLGATELRMHAGAHGREAAQLGL